LGSRARGDYSSGSDVDLAIDATIQRFEFTFELSWKLLKAILEYDGFENVESPRKAIREGFKQGYIRRWICLVKNVRG
tara:strand:+ start:518 stop:751 length:234 start_codon:yes stop_codon:yes gene_type:complete